jgi:hypothetical protein
VLFYFLCGFDKDAAQFFTFFAIVLIGQFLAVSFATLSVSISRNFGEATLFSNLAYTVQVPFPHRGLWNYPDSNMRNLARVCPVGSLSSSLRSQFMSDGANTYLTIGMHWAP